MQAQFSRDRRTSDTSAGAASSGAAHLCSYCKANLARENSGCMDGRLLAYQISDEWALFEGYICGDGQDPGCKRHQEDPPQDQAGMSWCSVPADLTCCAALVFCILMFDNVPSLITASKIRFSAFKCSHMLVEKIVSHRADRLLTVSFLANIVSRRTMRMQQRTDQIR